MISILSSRENNKQTKTAIQNKQPKMCFNRISPENISKQNDKVRFDFIIIKIHRLIREYSEILDELMSIETELYPSWWDGLTEQRYRNMLEIMMEMFNQVPKTSPVCLYVEGWSKETQKNWFMWADNLEKDVDLWGNILMSVTENDEYPFACGTFFDP